MDNTNASATTAALLEGLRQHAAGLLYLSETDAPFEVVSFPGLQGNAPTGAQLALWAGKSEAEAEKVETVALPYFLRNMTKEAAGLVEGDKDAVNRFHELQHFLLQQLQEVKVYRVGHRRITAFILGRTPAGAVVGLKTQLVET